MFQSLSDQMVFTALDWLGAYEAHLEQKYPSVNTREGYLQDLRVFGAWFEQENRQPLTPDMVTRVDLRAFRQYALKQERVSGATWNRRRASLAVFCRWALAAGFLEYDPLEDVSGVKVQKSAPRWLPRPEMNRFLRQVELNVHGANTAAWRKQALRDQAMIMLMLHAGLREEEVCNLDVADLALGERSGEARVRGKGEKQRRIPLKLEVRRALELWLAVRGAQNGALFSGKGSGRISTRLVQRRVAELGAQAGVQVTPHQLRHTFAKRTLDAGASLGAVQELLGHSDLNTTARYTRPGWDDLENAVEGW